MDKSNHHGSKSFLLLIASVAAFGGFLFGYDTAVIAGAIGYLQEKFQLSSTMVGWAASSAIWGCVIGAMFAGYLSDRYGRKTVLIFTAVIFGVSSYGAAVANDLTFFILMRMFGGMAVGAASMVSPLYISEVAPPAVRGRLVTLYQLAIVIGINIIYIINLKISQSGDHQWNLDLGWRYMLGSEVIPSVLFFLLLFFVPESPRWLVSQGKAQKAENTLQKINGIVQTGNIMADIKASLNEDVGGWKDLLNPKLRKPLMIGVVLALFSQITGINAIIYFAPEIFKSMGIGTESAFMQTIIIGFVNLAFTLVALWLIDRLGRRKLLMAGLTGMIFCLLGTGLCFFFGVGKGGLLLLFILGFIASFASSLGPIPWVIMAEIFPNRVRGIAMSLATLVLWIGVVLITQFTPMLLDRIGGAFTFWLFMVNSIILLAFTLRFIPETRYKSLEEIEKTW